MHNTHYITLDLHITQYSYISSIYIYIHRTNTYKIHICMCTQHIRNTHTQKMHAHTYHINIHAFWTKTSPRLTFISAVLPAGGSSLILLSLCPHQDFRPHNHTIKLGLVLSLGQEPYSPQAATRARSKLPALGH